MTAEKLNAAAWMAALQPCETPDEVPEGFFTVSQLASQLSKSESHMGKLVGDAVLHDRCERINLRITRNGRLRVVPHYKLK
jgi:hypothetical protein